MASNSVKVRQAISHAASTGPPSGPRRLPLWLQRPLAEPLVQFVLIGIMLSAAAQLWQARHNRHVIDLSTDVRQQIAHRYRLQFGRMPDEAQLSLLTGQYLREEVFLREALALHLDRDDEIVRRRLVQKYEFLQAESTPLAAPTGAELERWFMEHRARYEQPPTLAFAQLYFSPDRGGAASAQRRAQAALGHMQTHPGTEVSVLGDAFPGPANASDLSPADASRLFGESELTERLFKLPTGIWSGPYRSGYGWHLILVSAHAAAREPALAEVRERVLADCFAERRQLAADRAYQALRSRYVIRTEDGAP